MILGHDSLLSRLIPSLTQCGRLRSVGSAQWQWLQADLAGADRQTQPWLLVMGHRPMYIDRFAALDRVTSSGSFTRVCSSWNDTTDSDQQSPPPPPPPPPPPSPSIAAL
jgi:hypothetical protein